MENYSPRHRVLTRTPGDEDAPLNWRLKDMRVDDTLLVPYGVKRFGEVYNYVKSRASLWERFHRVEKVDEGTLVTRVGTRKEARVPVEPLSDRPEDGDWGLYTRLPHQRWNFPWKKMLPGDTFKVDKADMTFEQMRRKCYNKGTALGRRFKPVDSPIFAPGCIYVTCYETGASAAPVAIFGTINSKIQACYEAVDPEHAVDGEHDMRLSLNNIDIGSMKIGDVKTVLAKRVADPQRVSYIFSSWVVSREEPEGYFGRFAIDMYEDRIVIERVDDNMVQDDWQLEKQRRLQEALS